MKNLSQEFLFKSIAPVHTVPPTIDIISPRSVVGHPSAKSNVMQHTPVTGPNVESIGRRHRTLILGQSLCLSWNGIINNHKFITI